MATTLLFDSSALILYFNDAVSIDFITLITQAVEEGTAALSVITRAEVLAWPSHTVESIQTALEGMASFELFDVNAATADEAARIRRQHNIKLPDALIAATATLNRLSVVTANFSDFERVGGLTVLRF